jgi:hypothetical protein
MRKNNTFYIYELECLAIIQVLHKSLYRPKIASPALRLDKYEVIINYCLIAVGAGDVVECAASFIT